MTRNFDDSPRPDRGSSDDEIERRLNLRMDGRLGATATAELDRVLAASPRAKAIDDGLRGLHAALLAVAPPPAPSRDLFARTLSRVAAARAAREREGVVLPWIRGIAVAAALLLATNALVFQSQSVRADDDVNRQITIEDEIRNAPRSGADRLNDSGSLSDYLAWRFLRRSH